MSETFEGAIRRGAASLAEAGVEGAMRDAEVLMRWAAGLDGAALSISMRDEAGAQVLRRFDAGLDMRRSRAPLSHVTGTREFWGRSFEVTPDVLDPRPESETMIAAALEGPAPGKVLDLGVGSACLLATVLAERPEAEGVGVDASRKALAVARRNLERHGVAERATVRMGDWLDDMLEGFDLILCNPPYIAETEMGGLSPEVADHEPRLALTPGGDGMDPYRRIAPELAAFLRRKGRAFFEIGPTQAAEVKAIFSAFGWADPVIHLDMDGRERCLEYRRK